MKTVSRCLIRLRNFVTGQRGDARLREEIEEHVALQTEENIRAGMPASEARRQALIKVGAVEAVRESYHAEEGLPSVEGLVQDIRYACRVLAKAPGFAMAAVAILALGIGANLTVFLVLYGVLLRPLPFPEPRQLVRIERSYPDGSAWPAYSGTQALFFERANRSFQSMAAYDYAPGNATLIRGNSAVPVHLLHVTSGFFHVFGMEPALGRGFRPGEMVPNAPGVVVLSHALWEHQFNANPNILGTAITLGDRSYTVIGVANPRFGLDAPVDLWVPLPIAESANDRPQLYNLVGRLKPGATSAEAANDLKRVFGEMKDIYPGLWNREEGVRVLNLQQSLTGDLRPELEILMGAVGLVLLMVAANLMSLLLTRAVGRRRDTSVRVALGATGWRILRQLLAENALLCFVGGLAGVGLASVAEPLLMHLSPIRIPQFASLKIGGPAIAFAAALTLGCALIFSVVPALEARRTKLNETLQLNTARVTAGRHLAQRLLIIGEVAMSLVLLMGATLLLTTFWNLVNTSPGFQTRNVLTFKNSFTNAQAATSAQFGLRLKELTSSIEALPGVESAAAIGGLPTQLTPNMPFAVIGRPANQSNAGGSADYLPVTKDIFRTLGIPVITGRPFTSADTHGTMPVVIVNEEFARTYFGKQSPIGRQIEIGAGMGPVDEDQIRQIVGVVGNVKQDGLDQPAPASMYLPASQLPDVMTQLQNTLLGECWVVRTQSARLDVLSAIRKTFMQNAHAPLLSVESMEEVIDASVAQQRFSMILLCGFGLISLALGAAGLYGVMSYNVARQTKEIGVRMALGARRGDVAGMVLRDASTLVGIGLAIGIAASLLGGKILGSLLFGVKPRDPTALGAASGVLLLTALFAAWWPARRAARVEPMEALRWE
ncbi:MAG: ABC transporter permease [Acidobacteriaceae bacterium]